jgi:hypothetical protein
MAVASEPTALLRSILPLVSTLKTLFFAMVAGLSRPNVRDHTGGAQSVPERLKTEVRKERSRCLHLERFPYNQATSHH